MKKGNLLIFPILFVLLTSMACALPFSLPGRTGTEVPTEEGTMPVEPSSTTESTSTLQDACLVGVWTMDAYALNNKFLDLTQSPTMFVVAPSSMLLEFRSDNSYSISGDTTIRFDIPGGDDYMQMTGTHTGQGSYAADGSLLTVAGATYVVDFGPMMAYIDGESTVSPIEVPLPADFMSPPTSTSYRCSGNTLEITYEGPSGSVTEEWSR